MSIGAALKNSATLGGDASGANQCQQDLGNCATSSLLHLRLAMPSLGASNASRSRTGANRSQCFSISARNCSSDFCSLRGVRSLSQLDGRQSMMAIRHHLLGDVHGFEQVGIDILAVTASLLQFHRAERTSPLPDGAWHGLREGRLWHWARKRKISA